MPCGNQVCLTGIHRLQERTTVSWFDILAIVSCRWNITNKSVITLRCLCTQSVSIVSLWLYCHQFGVNSHSVAINRHRLSGGNSHSVQKRDCKVIRSSLHKKNWLTLLTIWLQKSPKGYESGKIQTQSVWTKNQDITMIYDSDSGRLTS